MSRPLLPLVMLLGALALHRAALGQTLAGTDAITPSAVRTGTATIVQQAPTIDGRLDESVWRNAAVYDGFVQRELREREPVTERTEVRILTDGEALYIGAWLYDRDPNGI